MFGPTRIEPERADAGCHAADAGAFGGEAVSQYSVVSKTSLQHWRQTNIQITHLNYLRIRVFLQTLVLSSDCKSFFQILVLGRLQILVLRRLQILVLRLLQILVLKLRLVQILVLKLLLILIPSSCRLFVPDGVCCNG